MTLDANLITAALTDPTQRLRARTHLQAFLASGGPPDLRIRNKDNVTLHLLTAAADAGWDGVVVDLLAAGTDVHINHDEPLWKAVIEGRLPVVQCLLAAGADVHVYRDEALRWASALGHLSVVNCLLAAGADVHAVDDRALLQAAAHGHLSVVERLLAAGADVHAGDDAALRRAAVHGCQAVIIRLLAAGADVRHAMKDCSVHIKPGVCKTLDAVPAAIPIEHRQELLDAAPDLFPALRALLIAEQRRSTRPHPATPFSRIRKP